MDDSRTSSILTTKVLNQYGYAVEYYEHGDAALEVLLDQHFDLLLLDFAASSAEGLGGEHLIRIIRSSGHPRNATLPIIVLAGNNDHAAVGQLKPTGANEIIMKPFKGKELDKVIRRLVASYRSSLGLPPLKSVVSVPGGRTDTPAMKTAQNTPLSAPISTKQTYTTQALEQRFQAITAHKAQDVPALENDDSNVAVAAPKTTREIPILEHAVRGRDDRQREGISSDTVDLTAIDITAANVIDARIVESTPAPMSHLPDRLAIIDARGEVVEAALDVPTDRRNRTQPKNDTSVTRVGAQTTESLDTGLLALLEKLEQGHERSAPNPFVTSYSPPKTDWLTPSKNLLSWKTAGVAVILGLAFLGVKKWSARESVAFNVVVAERGPIYEAISVPAKVVSKRVADVTPYFAGQLTKVEVKEGESVTKGQSLAQMDDRDAQSAVKRAEANLLSVEEEVSRASKNLQRLQRALELGAVSRQRVEDAEGEWRSASARHSVVDEELRSAKLALERMQIVAPFDGVVTSVFAHAGKWIAPPESIMTVVDISAQEVIAKVDATDASTIQVGHEVLLSNEAFAGKKWAEKVSRIAATTKRDNASNAIDVAITLSANAPALRVGQQVDAEIRLRGNPNAVKIPIQALVNSGGTTTVPILRGDKVHFVTVVTGIEDVASVEIVRGLDDGEQVVVTNGKVINEGQHIRVAEGG
ncbi:MAG: efflux RND transporter periplasmic adaptor subunit [Gammaproteobacteria bacterium]|nr:efflux RND transporter periplasmic adaptor subunit [Gammaproteobacteria bacterium]